MAKVLDPNHPHEQCPQQDYRVRVRISRLFGTRSQDCHSRLVNFWMPAARPRVISAAGMFSGLRYRHRNNGGTNSIRTYRITRRVTFCDRGRVVGPLFQTRFQDRCPTRPWAGNAKTRKSPIVVRNNYRGPGGFAWTSATHMVAEVAHP